MVALEWGWCNIEEKSDHAVIEVEFIIWEPEYQVARNSITINILILISHIL